MKLRKTEELKKKKATSPRKHPSKLSSKYPEDGPDSYRLVLNEAQSDGGQIHFMKILAFDCFRVAKEEFVDQVEWEMWAPIPQ